MTNAEVADRFEVVWAGGPLLGEYASNTTLTEWMGEKRTHSANPMIRERPRGHGAFQHKQYTTPLREAMCALKADGLSCVQIAIRFDRPVRSVQYVVMEGGRTKRPYQERTQP